MESLFAAIRQAAAMITKIFSTGEKFATAAEHLGTWAEQSAAAFSDEATHKRQINITLQRKEFEILAQEREEALDKKKSRVKAIAAPK
jgi:hypothetical protein